MATVKHCEYQCPECGTVIPKSERMQFTDKDKGESIMVCIDCYDQMLDADYARRLAAK